VVNKKRQQHVRPILYKHPNYEQTSR